MLLDPSLALCLYCPSSAPEDGTCHATAMCELGIGGIDDGIDLFFCQVAMVESEGLPGRQLLLHN
jgi:hypothetical protein